MKLISMTDFVLEQKQKISFNESTFINTELISLEKIRNYANFLKQPLKLEMFVPCDEDGDILEVPTNYENLLLNMMTEYNDEVYTYKQSKAKVLFEGFEVQYDNSYNTCLIYENNNEIKIQLQFRKIENDVRLIINEDIIHDCNNIERLVGLKNKPLLTENAVKQIRL